MTPNICHRPRESQIRPHGNPESEWPKLALRRTLVRQIVRGEREDVLRVRESSLTPWLPRLEQEWGAGCRNGAELWRRLRSEGFRGSRRVVGE